jgi:hypothetical protein
MSAALTETRHLCVNRLDCVCHKGPWTVCTEALGVCRDDPEKVVDLIHPWDWTTILIRPDAAVLAEASEVEAPLHYDMILFIALHHWPVRLLQENHNSSKAKEVLQKLGSCDTLVRRALRRIISGEMSVTPGATMSFIELAPAVNFLTRFLHCLSPVPWDRDIASLVRRAEAVIMESMSVAARAQHPLQR